MNTKPILDTELTAELVKKQLEKIFKFRLFAVSPILRAFLSYIVQETFAGRMHQIKEYSIAVSVLNKPSSFSCQSNCVVRVHARRMRDALKAYYEENDAEFCVIRVPTGRYIPLFEVPGPKQKAHLKTIPYFGYSRNGTTGMLVNPFV
jgi:hypothetical protein